MFPVAVTLFYVAATMLTVANGIAFSTSGAEQLHHSETSQQHALIVATPKTSVPKQNIGTSESLVSISSSIVVSPIGAYGAGDQTQYISPLKRSCLAERAPPEG